MIPKTKIQKEVVESMALLPHITEKQKKYAFLHCFEHIARKLRNGAVTCMDCGHTWSDKQVTRKCICPHCGAELKVEETRKLIFSQTEYFGVITSCNGYQVLRYFYLKANYRVGQIAEYAFDEVVQLWISPKGKLIPVARNRANCLRYYDVWNFSTLPEVKATMSIAYRIYPIAYLPTRRVIPELTKRGFGGNLMKMHPLDVFISLLTSCKMETLLKAGQQSLFKHFATIPSARIDKYWGAIKIAIRNRYIVKDASLWCDYIGLLLHFGKDIHNAKYVCPADLKGEHDRYLEKKREQQAKERIKEKRAKALAEEERFKELKSKFFGIHFSDGLIQIKVLESVEEHLVEGEIMHHCVFSCSYHLKAESLILSATIEGRRIETVEINLKTLEVVQSRGICNQNTEYHDRIVALVNKNRNLISSRLVA